jgi:hypothetical protein
LSEIEGPRREHGRFHKIEDVLNHYHLFGSGDAEQAESIVRRLLVGF